MEAAVARDKSRVGNNNPLSKDVLVNARPSANLNKVVDQPSKSNTASEGEAVDMTRGHVTEESSAESLDKTTYGDSSVCVNGYTCIDPDKPQCCGGGMCIPAGSVCCPSGVTYCNPGCNCFSESRMCSCEISSSSSCFSGNSLLTLKNGSTIPISKATLGLEILSYSYELDAFLNTPIVWIPHASNNNNAEFVTINTGNGHSLTLTKDHLLPSSRCNDVDTTSFSLQRAEHIKPNDCVHSAAGATVVTSTTRTHGYGLYTVVTMEQFIVVDGLVASPFAGNHYLPNAFYSLHRLAHRFGLSDSRGEPSSVLAAVTIMADKFIGFLLHSQFLSIVNPSLA